MIYETKNLYDQIFQFVRANGLCRSKAEFSRCFLGRSRTYWNAICRVGLLPSPDAGQTLILALSNRKDGPGLGDATREALATMIWQVEADILERQGGAQ
ncbi:DUF6626 family protein [Magnetospirillum gryphiswaldense]|uniref:DUF6626 family protein n=1 Tax=Magnetospirillum gryphiswaldense TaxID=55518 RepID=UPI00059F4F37|nr:DUF6626 family protein [Magnetospirillum gryphiswaldense]